MVTAPLLNSGEKRKEQCRKAKAKESGNAENVFKRNDKKQAGKFRE